MKKQGKRIISLLLSVVISCMGYVAFAADNIGEGTIGGDNTVSPQFTALSTCTRALRRDSSTMIYCDADTSVYSGYRAGVTIILERYTGNGWDGIKSWNNTPNKTFAAIGEYYNVVGGTYRLNVFHYAYNSDGTLAEVFQAYSDEVMV